MGILDDAIREHLELKRQHGADESEVEGLESEAFGPADRPDAIDPPTDAAPAEPPPFESEAMTQVISPGSAITVPAGEGDQLDKVFEAKREEQATSEHMAAEQAEPDETDAVEESVAPADIAEPAGSPPSGDERDQADNGEGDAGDALEAERQHLAGQPTEHYDVDAAIAEEDEIDLLSESRLADELDRALDGPADEPDFPPVPERRPEAEVPAAPEPEPDDSEFFDQDDPLEGTPDFLEETPEHDRLWFEQKEPKDFDFGD